MDSKITSAKYHPEIDSVRAIAVLFVLFHHYVAEKLSSLLSLGNFGVDIFFTLSGFLITGILISYRSIKPTGKALRKFYFRRILRIFPIYYLYILIVVLIFGKEISRTVIMWTTLYGLNFYIINHGLLNKYFFAHFWSLAVEEQFYLVWPFLILLISFKYLKSLILLAILVSIGFVYLNLSNQIMAYHPLACIQALAIGALVKYLTIFQAANLKFIGKRFNLFFLGLIMAWICSLISYDLGAKFAFPLLRVFASLTTAIVLIQIVLKLTTTSLNNFLDSRILQFIGKISYGMYVYHILVMVLLTPLIQKLVYYFTSEHNLLRYNLYVITLPLYSLITIFIAWLSFRYIEGPINRLKNRKASPRLDAPIPSL